MKAKLTGLAGIAMLAMASAAGAQSFSNSGAISLPAGVPGTTSGNAGPYPSTILVSGMGAGPWDVDITLNSISHTFPGDFDALLVAPDGTNIIFMSDIGGGTDIVNINLTFSDGAAAPPAILVSGTFAPTNGTGTDTFSAPAPAASANTSLNALGLGNVNGTWSLYINDDAGGDSGSIAQGWTITFTAVPAPGALALLGLAGLVGSRRRRLA